MLLALLVYGLPTSSPAVNTPEDWSLAFEVPEGWEAELFGGLADYFEIKKLDGSADLLLKVERNLDLNEEQLSAEMTVLADDPVNWEIDGAKFRGNSFGEFSNDTSKGSVSFYLTDGHQFITGKYNGPREDWPEVQRMLELVERSAWNTLGEGALLAEKSNGAGLKATFFSRTGWRDRLTYHLSILPEGANALLTNGNVAILDQPIPDFSWTDEKILAVNVPDSARVFYRNRVPTMVDAAVDFSDLAPGFIKKERPDDTEQAIEFALPEGWELNYDPEDGGYYTLVSQQAEKAAIWLQPITGVLSNSVESAQLQLNLFMEFYPRQVSVDNEGQLEVIELARHSIDGKLFSGKAAMATIRSLQDGDTYCIGYYYIVSGDSLFMGQFRGSTAVWSTVKSILASAKPYVPDETNSVGE
ncbi:hypothetical protein [Cerasicoccus fimbriatus]|uniref:hypothetical protein n=1 Tax=Cerasicoccus fimbriatus TaxID=3014554 RepID=UPI0022B5DBAD|nr:hypothetical protein [Cerasicoccus sp. TK19100]